MWGYSFPSISYNHTWEYNTKPETTFVLFVCLFPEHTRSRVEEAMVAPHFMQYFPKRSLCARTMSYTVCKTDDARKSLIYGACLNHAVWAVGWRLPGNTSLTALVLCG